MHKILEPKEPKDRKAKIKERRAKHARMEPGERKERHKAVKAEKDPEKKLAAGPETKKAPEKSLPEKDPLDITEEKKEELGAPQVIGKDEKDKVSPDVEVKTQERTVKTKPNSKTPPPVEDPLKDMVKDIDLKEIKLSPQGDDLVKKEDKKDGTEELPSEERSPSDILGKITENGIKEGSGKETEEEKKEEVPPTPLEASAAALAELASSSVNYKKRKGLIGWLLKSRLEKKRAKANASATEFLKNSAAQVQTVLDKAAEIKVRQEAAAEAAKAVVNEQLKTQQDVIKSATLSEKDKANADAEKTRKTIKTQYNNTVAAIKSSTTESKAALEKQYNFAVNMASLKQSLQEYEIKKVFYGEMRNRLIKAGADAGKTAYKHAKDKGEEKMKDWWGKEDIDDSLLDGPFTYNQNKARYDAALKVGEEYKKSFEEAGYNQANGMVNGFPDENKVIQKPSPMQAELNGLTEKTKFWLDILKGNQEENIKAFDTTQSECLTQARAIRNDLNQNVDDSLNSTLAALEQKEAFQLEGIGVYAQGQLQKIDEEKLQSITIMEDAAVQSVIAIVNVLSGFRDDAAKMEAPGEEELETKLKAGEKEVSDAVTMSTTTLEESIVAGENRQNTLGGDIANDIGVIGTNTVKELSETGAFLTPTMENLRVSAEQGFKDLRSVARESNANLFNNGTKGYNFIIGKLEEDLKLSVSNLQGGIEDLGSKTQTSMEETVTKPGPDGMDHVLDEEMEKAADEVKPRWKTVLKWILIIIIIIVIIVLIVVSGGMLLGAGAAVGGFLGVGSAVGTVIAGALIGAVVGGITSVLITMGLNLYMDKPIMEGTWDAFKSGFVTGFITGMAGPLANVFKITSTIGKITFTVAMDVYGAYEGMRVINQDFSWKDFLTQGGISLLVNIVTHKSFMPNLKASISSKFKFKVPKVDLPESTPQGPHGGPELPGGNKTTPHGEPELPGGSKVDDPNAPTNKPDKKTMKDMGDGHEVGLDEHGTPIMCSAPCTPLQTKFKDTIAGLQGDAKTKMLKDLDELDNMIAGPDKVNRTQELAAELNNIKNNRIVPPQQETRFLSDVEPESFGKKQPIGTVDTKPTIDKIKNGTKTPRNTYSNREGHPQLSGKPQGYWKEFDLEGFGGKSPMRILKGDGGEYFFTPDHYKSILPL